MSKQRSNLELVIRAMEKEDDVNQIYDLCLQNNLIGPNYATCEAAWNFHYINNPEGKAWNSILIDEGSNRILGHFGLIPFPMTANYRVIMGGFISLGVVSGEARNKLLRYKQSKTFAVIPLIHSCCYRAFSDKIGLIFAHSSIHPLIWKALKFDNLSLEVRHTWHLNLNELYSRYVRELRLSVQSGWKRHLIRPYSVVLTILQGVSKMVQSLPSSIKFGGDQTIEVREFQKFDQNFVELISSFILENPDLITYHRDISYLNWRFNNNKYAKYKILTDGRLIGYCIILKNEKRLGEGPFMVYDFIVLDRYLERVPEILNHLTTKEGMVFKFTHYLSCDYSYKVYDQCIKQGYQLVFSIPKLIRRSIIADTKTTFYYKLNKELPWIDANKKDFIDERKWFINPLFFGPRYYE